jgi:hypothetical protein
MSLLDRLDVASPCQESWEDMEGDAQVRHCQRCDHAVYDLSGLPEDAALGLLERAAGGERICGRFKRRADGRVITADCPSQLQKARGGSWIRRVAGLLVTLVGAGLASGCQDEPEPVMGLICPEPPPSQPAEIDSQTAQAGGRRLPQAG